MLEIISIITHFSCESFVGLDGKNICIKMMDTLFKAVYAELPECNKHPPRAKDILNNEVRLFL